MTSWDRVSGNKWILIRIIELNFVTKQWKNLRWAIIVIPIFQDWKVLRRGMVSNHFIPVPVGRKCALRASVDQRINAEVDLAHGIKYTVSVRTLCEFTSKEGDLDLRFTPAPSVQEGIAGHGL